MFKVFKSFNIPKNLKKSILLIGNFDGLHLGHQKIFKQAKTYSKKNKLKIGVLTFDPLPIMFFNKTIKNHRLTDQEQKFSLLKKIGVNFVINKKFDRYFSRIKSEDFIKKIIFKKINPKFIFVSNNFRFGNNREGNVQRLKKKEKDFKYHVIKPSPLKNKNTIISSTRIRKLLQKGKIKNANKLLSRNWSINGFVSKGKSLGKKLGYPTCNIKIKSYIIPKIGVYSVKIKIKNSKKILNGIANLGFRPTFGGKELILEVNLFGFSGNLYKKTLKVYFCEFIRKEKKFKNQFLLISQIKKDLKKAKIHLKKKIIL